jgi:hypothetical protein
MPESKTQDVVALAYDRFGPELAEYLLWEQTCFPLSAEVALAQMRYLIAKADRGESPTLDGWVPG